MVNRMFMPLMVILALFMATTDATATCTLPAAAAGYVFNGATIDTCTSDVCTNPNVAGVSCATGYTDTISADQGSWTCLEGTPEIVLSDSTGCAPTPCTLPTQTGYLVQENAILADCYTTESTGCSDPDLQNVNCASDWTGTAGIDVVCTAANTVVVLSGCTPPEDRDDSSSDDEDEEEDLMTTTNAPVITVNTTTAPQTIQTNAPEDNTASSLFFTVLIAALFTVFAY